jgi:site-specific recombinase XerD
MATPSSPARRTRIDALVATGLVVRGTPLARSIEGLLNGLHSDGSVATYSSDLVAYLRYCAASGVDPLVADRDHLQGYLAETDDRGYAPDTRRRMLSVVRRMYAEAIERTAYRGANPADRLGRISGEPKPGEAALSAEETQAMLDAAELRIADPDSAASLRGRRDHLVLSFLVWTGLRAAELAGIERGDIRSHGEYRVVEITGKGDKGALVKLTDALDRLVATYLETLDAAGIAVASDDPLFFGITRGTPPVVERRGGRIAPLTTRTIGRIVDEALKAVGREGRRTSPHLLRRTSVTLVYQASHDVLLAQKHARHANGATTVKHYIKPLDDLADAGVDYIKLPERE